MEDIERVIAFIIAVVATIAIGYAGIKLFIYINELSKAHPDSLLYFILLIISFDICAALILSSFYIFGMIYIVVVFAVSPISEFFVDACDWIKTTTKSTFGKMKYKVYMRRRFGKHKRTVATRK